MWPVPSISLSSSVCHARYSFLLLQVFVCVQHWFIFFYFSWYRSVQLTSTTGCHVKECRHCCECAYHTHSQLSYGTIGCHRTSGDIYCKFSSRVFATMFASRLYDILMDPILLDVFSSKFKIELIECFFDVSMAWRMGLCMCALEDAFITEVDIEQLELIVICFITSLECMRIYRNRRCWALMDHISYINARAENADLQYART